MSARLSPRPVIGSPADEDLLVTPDGLEAAHRNVALGLNVLIEGAPGAGKTTFLYALEHELRTVGMKSVVVYVNGAAAEDEPAGLLAAVTAQLHQQRLIGETPLGVPDKEAVLLAELQSAPKMERSPVVLVDGAPSPEAAYGLFGRLRDELWAAPLVWVVAVDLETAAALHRPPADAFFSATFRLGPLTREEAADLVHRRAPELTDHQIRSIVEAGGGSPRGLISAARRIVTGEITADELHGATVKERMLRESLPAAARTVLDYLVDVGPASASDERFLAEVGMSRPNVVRLFGMLENAGLVRGETLREGANRRPRKVYRRVVA
jgi:hypothetical protein